MFVPCLLAQMKNVLGYLKTLAKELPSHNLLTLEGLCKSGWDCKSGNRQCQLYFQSLGENESLKPLSAPGEYSGSEGVGR